MGKEQFVANKILSCFDKVAPMHPELISSLGRFWVKATTLESIDATMNTFQKKVF